MATQHKNGALGSQRRRSILKLSAVAIAAPTIWIPKATAASQIFVRTPGGAYDEIRREVVYEPFRKATGIEVVPVAANVSKMFAMFKSGQAELDVVDTGDWPLLQLAATGAFAPIPYKQFQYSDPNDIDTAYRKEFVVGSFVYAVVMAYNTTAFAKNSAPRSWLDFWDVKKFPGARMLADMTSGSPDLEIALLADGVPRNELYPLDVDRAFRSLSRLRPSIRKFWDSGALAAQMIADNEVVAGSIWNDRVEQVIDKGAPIALNWNDHMVEQQAMSIVKNSKNMDGAVKFVDYCLSADVQKQFALRYSCGPVSRKAHDALPASFLARIPGGDLTREQGFIQNGQWWADNRASVSEKWSTWILNR